MAGEINWRLEQIGKDGGRLLIIDEAMQDPALLKERACSETFVRAGAVYPGIRAPLPHNYVTAFLAKIAPLIEDAFGKPLVPWLDSPSFSIVTVPPAQLAANQRTPHVDANANEALAFIHYLCDPAHGGTAFYRHKATGFERIGPDREAHYNAIVAEQLGEREQIGAGQFMSETDTHFERIELAENRFNRMLVYYGNSLHSGDIRQADKLSADPREGRLTITGFLELKP